MAKYRLLTISELQELETEFVEYLVLNGIDKDTWVKLKSKSPSEAEQIVDLFSDVVFEKILRQIKYLRHTTPTTIRTFRCAKDEIQLIGLETQDPNIDLSTEDGWEQAKKEYRTMSIYTQTKSYQSKGREQELYHMMEQGCVREDGAIYHWLEQLL